MRPGTAVHITGAAIVAASLALWAATGREGFTRWPDQRLAQSDAPPAPGETELLAAAGFTDSAHTPARPDIQSRFAFGLIPGGATPRHLISVATALALAIGASSTVSVIRLARNSTHPHAGAARTSGEQP